MGMRILRLHILRNGWIAKRPRDPWGVPGANTNKNMSPTFIRGPANGALFAMAMSSALHSRISSDIAIAGCGRMQGEYRPSEGTIAAAIKKAWLALVNNSRCVYPKGPRNPPPYINMPHNSLTIDFITANLQYLVERLPVCNG